MCGICGAIQLSGTPRALLEDGGLERMSQAMVHRGPDDSGEFRAPGVAFAARRLSIVDVEGGHQPFANEDGSVWAVQNGELFNHVPLRKSLERRGHSFRSRCDTEILPHLYEQHGAEFPRELRGMFAVAVWDERARRGVVVRDRLGIKPLYYAVSGDQLLFASELKCLLASGCIAPELDYEAIDAYLVLGLFPGPATPLRAVRKLQPGHRIVVDPTGWRVEQWWSYPEPTVVDPERSVDEWSEILLAELRESVRLRLMSDVPLGAMLSGGLDSSLIVALMSSMMTEPVQTFSVGFVDAGVQNELSDARAVAEMYATDHHELQLTTRDAIDLSDLVWHLDEPLADLSALGFIALCGLARRDVTVALSGQGADELFGGYRRHTSALLADRFSVVPEPLRRALGRSARFLPAKARRPAMTIASSDPASRHLALTSNMDPRTRASLVRGPLSGLDGRAAWRALSALVPQTHDPLGAALVLDARLGLVDDMLHYFDRASMAHSLEVRVPFLDHHLVELSSTIPSSLKVRDGTTKYILKHAARGLVPDRLIDKPKVGFFNAAVDTWFASEAGQAASDVLLDPGARYLDMIDPDVVARLLARQRGDRHRRAGHALLTLMMLELWLATFLPRAMHQSGSSDVETARGVPART